ncbi:MAG: class I SAM-dependent methyltransferase [Algicola sp.]|nr:class I SAM-dependent methyltransferase [Algicola sp.]
MKKWLLNLWHAYKLGNTIRKDRYYTNTLEATRIEINKKPRRTEIINYFLSLSETKRYLEIGVRNPQKNFNRINAKVKYSVDPGIEFKENPVDFKMTSDEFFKKLGKAELSIPQDVKFDVVFIDGLHIANQVERDINHAFQYLSKSGVIILHDCNPPTIFHQREDYDYENSPARTFWNGTTWKAFYKFRHHQEVYSICFDSDWGVGILALEQKLGFNHLTPDIENPYYAYNILQAHRKQHLNLQSFTMWKLTFENN